MATVKTIQYSIQASLNIDGIPRIDLTINKKPNLEKQKEEQL